MSKFKKGDLVIVKETGQIGTIKGVCLFTISEVKDIYGYCPTGHHYDVEFEDGSIDTFLEGKLGDPTTAFLTELQALMKLYNVVIKYTYDKLTDDDCPLICINGKKLWYKEYTDLTPDNIFDYEH